MNLDDVGVWVIDSSALIKAKRIVSLSNQWSAFKHLEQLAVDGQIALPRQVIKEMGRISHPDLPGAWATGIRELLQHPVDAGYGHLGTVMSFAPDVVDVNKDSEDADPWPWHYVLRMKAIPFVW